MAESAMKPEKRRIMLVDDEPGIRLMLSMLLEEEGYEVISAKDGREALELLRIAEPDAVITDYMMPHLTGLQLITAIRELPNSMNTPILLMSAALPSDVDLASVKVPFLAKPANLDRLLNLLEQLIASSQSDS